MKPDKKAPAPIVGTLFVLAASLGIAAVPAPEAGRLAVQEDGNGVTVEFGGRVGPQAVRYSSRSALVNKGH